MYDSVTVFLWSLSYVFKRIALKFFSPFSLGFIRYFFASCFWAVVLIFMRTKCPKKVDVWLLLLSGATGFFLYMVAFNAGSRTVSAATRCTVIATAPLITTLLARTIYKEKLTKLKYISLAVSFCGVVAYCSWTKAFSLASDTASVSNYMFIEPFLTAIFGFSIAHEKITLPNVIGGSVIVIGLFVFYFGDYIMTKK